ncbi:MAG TPA: response regulator [Usitatibacteraceae bacterium]|nr:response regulator [Usitatibacteraceae bacterium]
MICIVDDEEPIRDSLAWLLKSRGYESRAFDSAIAFRDFAAGRGRPDTPGCVILDVRMPEMSGIELFDELRAGGLHLAWPVIFLTGHGDVPMAVTALKNGAFDFVEKPMNDNTLVDKVAAALAASARHLAQDLAHSSLQARLAQLTEREHAVMKRIVAGQFNKVIADEMGIAMRTVEVYRARIFQKMGVRTAVELANLLRKPGELG